MIRNEEGETVPVDLASLREDFEEWRDVIGLVFQVESMTTTTRSEFDRVPAKYNAIARIIGADRLSREDEREMNLLRMLTGGTK